MILALLAAAGCVFGAMAASDLIRWASSSTPTFAWTSRASILSSHVAWLAAAVAIFIVAAADFMPVTANPSIRWSHAEREAIRESSRAELDRLRERVVLDRASKQTRQKTKPPRM
jgi:hypothetical protein